MTDKDIQQLIDMYLDGETTPADERLLARALYRHDRQGGDMPEEWQTVRLMLGELAMGEAEYDEIMSERQQASHKTKPLGTQHGGGANWPSRLHCFCYSALEPRCCSRGCHAPPPKMGNPCWRRITFPPNKSHLLPQKRILPLKPFLFPPPTSMRNRASPPMTSLKKQSLSTHLPLLWKKW